MRRASLTLSLAVLAFQAWNVSARANDPDWQRFATSKSATVFFDRASLREDGDYVHYAVRVDLKEPRDTKSGKYRYQSALSRIAARCDRVTYATTGITLFGSDGEKLTEQQLEPVVWEARLKEPKPKGLQLRLIKHACAKAGRPVATDEADKDKPKKKVKATLGAGIVASRDGAIITNQHVVNDCLSITVMDGKKKRHQATLISSDRKNDLALLRAKGRFENAATFRDGRPVEAGESVTVVGYPLAAILGTDPNVNFGYVTALAGLRGDSSRFQVAAPIHKGNSGGPVLDQSGRVTGIVTAKLNARAVEKRTGDLPQNIGFAVRGELAQLFLERNEVRFESDAGGVKLDNTEVAAIGRAVTVLIACRRNP
jgi:S1-C subfamily serine protease